MKTFEELQQHHKSIWLRQVREGTLHRLPRQRPPDPEKDEVLSRLTHAAIREWRESGKFVRLGPRQWFFRMDDSAMDNSATDDSAEDKKE